MNRSTKRLRRIGILVAALSLGFTIMPVTSASAQTWDCNGSSQYSSYNWSKPWAGSNWDQSNGWCGGHSGVDWDKINSGETTYDIYSAPYGKVIKVVKGADADPCYGNYVVIEDQIDSDNTIVYAHLSVVSVTLNQIVYNGEKIGKSGATGDCADFVHLHVSMTTDFTGWYTAAPNNTHMYNPRTFLGNHGITWGGME